MHIHATMVYAGIFVSAASLSGCVKSEMRFHFAAANLEEEHPRLTFYRITVTGESGNESSRLQTGFYDQDALHALFGQVTDDPKGNVKKAEEGRQVGHVLVQLDPGTGHWRIVERNERFTVLWGTNADAMAQQIGAFADGQTTGDGMASLIAAAAGAETLDATRSAKVAAEEKETSRAKLASRLKSLAAEIADLPKNALTMDAIRAKLRAAAQSALTQTGTGLELSEDLNKAFAEASGAYSTLK